MRLIEKAMHNINFWDFNKIEYYNKTPFSSPCTLTNKLTGISIQSDSMIWLFDRGFP